VGLDTIAAGLRSRRTLVLMSFDALAIAFAYLGFALLGYGLPPSVLAQGDVVRVAAVAVVLQWTLGSLLRVYQGRATVASLEETIRLGVAAAGVTVVLGLLDMGWSPSHRVPRSLPLGATFLALFVMLLGRALWRRHHDKVGFLGTDDASATLVFGAGSGGRQLVRSMLATPAGGMRPVGLLDDDPWKRQLRIDGVPVLGSRGQLELAAARTAAAVLVIAIPSADPALIRELSTEARSLGL
jgi:FlaA1/EpsC-like NDP-sugar epimerase